MSFLGAILGDSLGYARRCWQEKPKPTLQNHFWQIYVYFDQPILIKRDVAVVASCDHTMLSGFRNEVSHKIPLRFHDLINLAFWQEVIDVEDLDDWREFVHPDNTNDAQHR